MEENSMKAKEDEEEMKKSVVDLDSILVEEIGQFGWYQLRTVALLALAVVFIAVASSDYIFTTARIPSRCLIPECEDPTRPAQFAPPWILHAVPARSGGGFDNCQRFANASAGLFVYSCPAALFDRNSQLSCDQYVYENTNTVVYDFELACDEWRRSLIGSLRTLGVLAGLPLCGFVSDRWGRRTALALSAFNMAWLGVVRYWTSTYVGFAFSQVAQATFGSGGFSCSYIFLMELVGPQFREKVGALLNTFFAVGMILASLIAWAVPNWKHLTLALYIPQLVTLAYFWILPESVRWYISKGRYEESEKVLKKIARVNGKQLSNSSLRILRQTSGKEKTRRLLDERQKMNEPWLIVLVFRHKPILLRVLVSPVWWITMTLIYHGLSINSVNMSGSQYVNYMVVAVVEIPGFWLAVLLMSRVGRKPVLCAAFWVCAVCQIAYLFLPAGQYGASLTVYLIGKCSIAMVGVALYVYTAELYPTCHRHSLFAFSSMMGRIGAVVAPLTPAFGGNLPFILFAGFALLSGLLVLLTPETLGTRLPDTMEQAARIGIEPRTNRNAII